MRDEMRTGARGWDSEASEKREQSEKEKKA